MESMSAYDPDGHGITSAKEVLGHALPAGQDWQLLLPAGARVPAAHAEGPANYEEHGNQAKKI